MNDFQITIFVIETALFALAVTLVLSKHIARHEAPMRARVARHTNWAKEYNSREERKALMARID